MHNEVALSNSQPDADRSLRAVRLWPAGRTRARTGRAVPAEQPAAEQPAALAAPAAEAQKLKFCFAFQDLETEFWMAGHKAIIETLEGQGHKVIEVNSNEDANKQLEQIKNCIAQGVDGIMVIRVDGSIALKLIEEANTANIPIGIFNRPPQNEDGNALTVVANNEKIAEQAVEYMAQEAQKLGKKMTPLIMVGDWATPTPLAARRASTTSSTSTPISSTSRSR